MKKIIIILVSIFFISSFAYSQSDEEVQTTDQSVESIESTETSEDTEELGTENSEESAKKASLPSTNKRKSFAMGMNLHAMLSNSYFNINEFFGDGPLVVDLNAMNDKIPKSGYGISILCGLDLFLDIYLKDKYKFGLFLDADAYSLIKIPKSLINFLAEGNADTPRITDEINSTASIFVEQSAFFGMKIKDLSFRVNTSWFVPLIYLDKYIGKYEYVNSSDGKTKLKGELYTRLYSPLPIFGGQNSKFSSKDISKSLGFDIDFIGAYNLPPYARVNFGLLNIPIVPAHLHKGIGITYKGNFELESLVAYMEASIQKDEKAKKEIMTSNLDGEVKKGYNLKRKAIFRPLKLIASADVYPLQNELLIVTPSLAMHCLKPFYVDLGVRVESHFAKVLGAYIDIKREDRIWKHKLGAFVDARAVRFELAAALSSPNFIKSFSGTGAQIDLTVVFGY